MTLTCHLDTLSCHYITFAMSIQHMWIANSIEMWQGLPRNMPKSFNFWAAYRWKCLYTPTWQLWSSPWLYETHLFPFPKYTNWLFWRRSCVFLEKASAALGRHKHNLAHPREFMHADRDSSCQFSNANHRKFQLAPIACVFRVNAKLRTAGIVWDLAWTRNIRTSV